MTKTTSIKFTRIPLRKLGKIAKREVYINPTESYRTLGCRLYGQGVYQRETKVGSEISAKKMFLVKENDFVINRIWAQKGSAGIVTSDISGSVVTPDFPVYELNIQQILPRYVSWYVQTEDFWNECKSHSRGTSGRQRISPREVPNISFPVCDIRNQKKIVVKIENVMEKVKGVKKIKIESTEDTKKLLDSALHHLDLSVFETTTCKINQCSKMKTGKTPSTSIPYYFDGDINWYCPSDLDFSHTGYLEDSKRKITHLAVSKKASTVYEKDTVLLVAIGGSIGKVALTKEMCSSNQQITGISFNDEIIPWYGYYWMRKLYHEILRASSQATLPIINQKKIGNLEITYPKDKHVQSRITNFFATLQEKINALMEIQAETEKEIEKLVPSILDKAFKGIL